MSLQIEVSSEGKEGIRKISVKKIWICIGIVVGICLIILALLLKKYLDLQNEDWDPYVKPMENLKTALALGLRNHKVKYIDSLKVSDIVVKLPEHIQTTQQDYDEVKKKYQNLYKTMRHGGNWLLLGWNLYYISKDEERKTWHDAESFCTSRDAHLTSILSEEEQKYISSQHIGSAWIGLTDETKEGTWKWSDGSKLTIQYYWNASHPNGSWFDGDEEDCVFMDTSVSGPNWKNANCKEYRRWVCKERLNL